MQTLHVLAALSVLGYVLTLALLPVVLLTKKKQPVSTVAWIMAIVTMPYFGALLFTVFGINRVERRLRGKQAATRSVSQTLASIVQASPSSSRSPE